MLIEYKFYPKHLGPEFLEVYKQIKEERVEDKHNGNNVKNENLKLALNGLINKPLHPGMDDENEPKSVEVWNDNTEVN